MFVVLPRKVAGVIFCLVGVVAMGEGIFGLNSGNSTVGILVGALFGGIGWIALRTSTSKTESPQSMPLAKLASEENPDFGKRSRSAHWTHAIPTKAGLYWYRSNWQGKQEDPELVTYEPEAEFRSEQFTTAGLISLFREDFEKMNAEFWTEPVTPHKPPPAY